MVVVREGAERRVSARSKTFPENMLYRGAAVDALVDDDEGTVAWAAGPRAALNGVAGSGATYEPTNGPGGGGIPVTSEAGGGGTEDMGSGYGVADGARDIGGGGAAARELQGEVSIKIPASLTALETGRRSCTISVGMSRKPRAFLTRKAVSTKDL